MSRTSRRPSGIQPRHRLVEDHELRIVDERLRQSDTLHHALGVLAHRPPPIGAETHAIEQAARAAPRVVATMAEQPAKIDEQFLRGELVVERRILRQEAQALPGVGRRRPAGRSSSALPDVGRRRFSRSLSVVLLPAPFGPRRPKTPPAEISNDRASSAR